MEIPAGENPVSQAVARAMLDGFNKHYRLFRESSALAKVRFESGDWLGVQRAVRERIAFYDTRVNESAGLLHEKHDAGNIDDNTWQLAKLLYIGLLTNHKQPELAETFFNSVFCKIMHRTYFHNDFIFVRPAVSTDFIESDPPAYRSYYPNKTGLRQVIHDICADFRWSCAFANAERDIDNVINAVERQMGGRLPAAEANFQIQVLHSAFYRNKAAYIVGKAINGDYEYPFVVPVLHDSKGRLFLDAILLDSAQIRTLFSLSRAYFMVDMEVPSAYVDFLAGLMPHKPAGEIYTMLGLAKQGKTMFYRDLMHHLRHSQDEFVIAPGIPGMVMSVFTLPSFPYVFKAIRDVFAPAKEVDHATVKAKYVLVKQHDRVGRMADTLEFSNVALPKARFSAELLDELRRECASLMEEGDDEIVIQHLYIERRMKPLNLYLDSASEARREAAVIEYGNAIKELAYANIFPGDMLFKNFGVTRFGRVVFYDYDEIEYMTDCNFRRIPPPPNPEAEMSGEVWYSVGRHDVFPEEFGTFLLGNPETRRVFMKHHADLLEPAFWQQTKQMILDGYVPDFFPYPEEMRFCRMFAGEAALAPQRREAEAA
ncbi:MAG: Isocitrate dehydrogenase kinase/phosphatase [Rhodocyclaceae bacterium]|nr:MAG: bifunctional isocitrate dehydrogenase kinase/phosphatase [Rhodocyclaceae bacterium]MBE7422646.1 bifunctional isocitrate dehydrogenase kinase/phosphatase [Zoogloeaceae bacterium]MBV6407366.1 Isocitrate dehydrogenase kinase/phosphatase [Rhodocyclaceae bacterium]MCK6383795.1 bifunctional isocitrate dehydrogenase kinase/phosphatase [Rhodocyclaceae bacterium]CAG1010143.1 Isocitrate dehydrogenase kinase/phosphatase [Burkholderiales bacterium]